MINVKTIAERKAFKDVILWTRLNDGSFNGYVKVDVLPVLPEPVKPDEKAIVEERIKADEALAPIVKFLADKFAMTEAAVYAEIKGKVAVKTAAIEK